MERVYAAGGLRVDSLFHRCYFDHNSLKDQQAGVASNSAAISFNNQSKP